MAKAFDELRMISEALPDIGAATAFSDDWEAAIADLPETVSVDDDEDFDIEDIA